MLGPVCLGPESQGYSMPPRTTQESHRPRVSDRTMVGTWQPLRLSVSEPDGVVTNRKMKLLGWGKISSLAASRDEPSSWDREPEQNQKPKPPRKRGGLDARDRKSTRLNSSHGYISYAVFCLKKKKKRQRGQRLVHLICSHSHLLHAEERS